MARERSIRFSRTFGVWGGCLKIEMQDRFRGCLIGGSLGDALGYPMNYESVGIKKKIRSRLVYRNLCRDVAAGLYR